MISNEIANTRGIFSNLCTSAVQLIGYRVSYDILRLIGQNQCFDTNASKLDVPVHSIRDMSRSSNMSISFPFEHDNSRSLQFSLQRNTESRIKLKLPRVLFSHLLNSCFSCNHVPTSSVAFTI